MTTDPKKRRARHVASDEAHAWARSLPLDNPNAKTVLRALALYVNGEACCFVSMEQLAEDTDLSVDTVRRRLVWLESVGAIVRLPQWLDENGRRNGEGRGRRTTDDIRLLLDADIDEIDRRAHSAEATGNSGASAPEPVEISPSTQLGVSEGIGNTEKTVSTRLALGQPLQSCEGLISEPEPEDSPQPPSGGSVAAEGWKDFEGDWFEPILRQSIAQQVWAALTPAERNLARQAARGYRVWRSQQKKPPNVLGAHLFLKERDAWEKFAKLAPDAGTSRAPTTAYDLGSREAKAILAMHAVARTRPFESRGRIVYRGEVTPQVLAFADDKPCALWIEDRQQIGAWANFLKPRVQGGPGIMTTRGIGLDERRGMYVPHPWPPLKDGTWSTTGPPDAGLSEADADDFK